MTVTKKIQQFLKLMQEHDSYGATDTEPRNAFYNLLEQSMAGKELDEEIDPDYWELYSSMENYAEIANELTAKYRQLHDEIQEAPHKEIVDACNYFGIDY